MKGEYLKVKEPLSFSSLWQKIILGKNYYILAVLLIGILVGLISMIPEFWRTTEMTNISFEYQGNFSKIDSGETDDLSYEAYVKDKSGKYASYYLLEIKNKDVYAENVFGNLLEKTLAGFKSEAIDYSDVQYFSNAIAVKPKYKIKGKEFTGYAFLYTKDSKADVLFFLPYEENYSAKTFERIIGSIKEK